MAIDDATHSAPRRPHEPSLADAQAAARSGRGLLHADRILIVISVTSLLMGLDGMMVNLALPHVKADFGAGPEVGLVVTAYFLGTIGALPAMRWLTGRWGTRRPYLWSLLALGALSMLSASAPNLPVLVLARLLAGLAGSPAIPATMTIVTTIYPPERRGRAMAIWGGSGIIAPAIAPTIGGQIADVVSWRYLFLFSVPMMAGAYVMNRRSIPDVRTGDPVPLDPIGIVLGPTGLAATLLGISQGRIWGWTSPATVLVLTAGVLALTLFVVHDRRAAHPLLDLGLLRLRGFPVGSLLAAAMLAMVTSRLLFVPLGLADVRGYGTGRIGLLLAPAALTSGIALLISGRTADRVGPRPPLVAGALISVAANVSIALWTPSTPDWVLLTCICAHGLGTGLFMSNALVTTLWRVPPDRMPGAATLRQILLQAGGAASPAVLTAVLGARLSGATTRTEIQSAYSTVFVILSALAAMAFFAALRIPKGVLARWAPNDEHSSDRAAPQIGQSVDSAPVRPPQTIGE